MYVSLGGWSPWGLRCVSLEPLGLMFVCQPLWLEPMGAIMSQPWWLEPDILYQPWWLGPMEANIESALVAGVQGANNLSAVVA